MDFEPVNTKANKECPDKVNHEGTSLEDLGVGNPGATLIVPVVHFLSARVHAHVYEAARSNHADVCDSDTPPSRVESADVLSDPVLVALSGYKE
jgi:hypothetical protein